MREKICVIVPARGCPKKIDECIESIINTKYPRLDIIVVDDGIEPLVLERLGQFGDRVRVLKSGARGPSYARNLAAAETGAEFIAFTDSDCVVENNWIGELLRGFREFPGIAACGGAQEIPSDATSFEKSVFSFMKKCGFISDYTRAAKSDMIIKVNHNPSCNVMYRRDIFLKESGFLEGLWPGEDVELDYRLKKKGYELIFNPSAVVYHYRPENLESFCRMMRRYGFAQGILVKKYGFFRKIHYLPLFFLIALFPIFLNVSYGAKLCYLSVMAFGFLSAFAYFGGTLNALAVFFLTVLNWHLGFLRGLFEKMTKSDGQR